MANRAASSRLTRRGTVTVTVISGRIVIRSRRARADRTYVTDVEMSKGDGSIVQNLISIPASRSGAADSANSMASPRSLNNCVVSRTASRGVFR